MRARRRRGGPAGGRPKVDPHHLKSCQVNVRFTPAELERLHATARLASRPLPDLIRAAALQKKVVPRAPEIHYEAVGELRKIREGLLSVLHILQRRGGASETRSQVFELLRLIKEIRQHLVRRHEPQR